MHVAILVLTTVLQTRAGRDYCVGVCNPSAMLGTRGNVCHELILLYGTMPLT